MRPLSETDGSCASCHKVKDGTVSGSISGSAVTPRMSFALGGTRPTPTCEPAVGLGTITMTRRWRTLSASRRYDSILINSTSNTSMPLGAPCAPA